MMPAANSANVNAPAIGRSAWDEARQQFGDAFNDLAFGVRLVFHAHGAMQRQQDGIQRARSREPRLQVSHQRFKCRAGDRAIRESVRGNERDGLNSSAL